MCQTVVRDVPSLVKLLKHDSAIVRRGASETLGEMQPEGKAALAALEKLFNDKDVYVRIVAAEAVGKLTDGGTKSAADVVLAVLKDRCASKSLRTFAIVAAGSFCKHTSELLPILIKTLADMSVDWTLRENAARSLGRIGPQAKPATKALIRAMRRDVKWPVRAFAADALGLIDPDTKIVVNPLLRALRDKNGNVRIAAAVSLGSIDRPKGVKLKVVVAALVRCLGDPDAGEGMLGYMHATSLMGSTMAAALIKAATGSRDWYRRSNAIGALCIYVDRMIPDERAEYAKKIVPLLLTVLEKDRHGEVRGSAAARLGGFPSAAEKTIPALIIALNDRKERVVLSTITGLGTLGPAATKAIPALEKFLTSRRFLTDRQKTIHREAKLALIRIRGIK